VDLAASPRKSARASHCTPNTHPPTRTTTVSPLRTVQSVGISNVRRVRHAPLPGPQQASHAVGCESYIQSVHTCLPPCLTVGSRGFFFGILHAITVQPLHCLTFWDFAKPLSLSNGRSGPWLCCLPASLASFPITSHAHPPGCAASQCPGRLSHIATFHAGWSRMAGATLGRCNYPGTIPPNRSFPAATEVGILSAAFLVRSMHFTD
jgi:hypothetical protein